MRREIEDRVTTSNRIVESFELQTEACRKLESPMYEAMLSAATSDLRGGGIVAEVVDGFEQDPVPAALPLRLMGGVHRLVLMGLEDGLARHYPTVGGAPDLSTIGADFIRAVEHHRGYLRDALAVAPQTNDIGRSTPLIAGLFVAAAGAKRIRLLEIGSAGGLNLLLDRYRFEATSWQWGSSRSEAVVRTAWSGPPPPTIPSLDISERHGCDVEPMDVLVPEQQLRLLSFIWPDQTERFDRTRGALAIARRHPPVVDRAPAAEWLRSMLERNVPRKTLTVIQHSVMWQYLGEAEQTAVERVIEDAGAQATRARPLAHVSFEPAPTGYDGRGMLLRVVSWPGRVDRPLGRGHPHGAWFEWEPQDR